MRRMLPLCVLAMFGCLPLVQESATTEVGFNQFGAPPPPAQRRQTAYTPGPTELSERVYYVGSKIIAANNQIGLRPSFITIGKSTVEIFHTDSANLFVTAGLVQQCKNEADLAAVLSLELGKMVAEREATVHPRTRRPEALPPIAMPTGNQANRDNSDFTHLAELGKHERAHPRTQRVLPPDPMALAQSYLQNAGYPKDHLEAVAPLLQAAEQNYDLEKQFRTPGQGNWKP